MDIIRTRQKNWIGHILRGNSLQREIMEGRMEGRRQRGRPKQILKNCMMEDGYWKLKEKAQHPEEWSRWTFGPAGRQNTYMYRRRRLYCIKQLLKLQFNDDYNYETSTAYATPTSRIIITATTDTSDNSLPFRFLRSAPLFPAASYSWPSPGR